MKSNFEVGTHNSIIFDERKKRRKVRKNIVTNIDKIVYLFKSSAKYKVSALVILQGPSYAS